MFRLLGTALKELISGAMMMLCVFGLILYFLSTLLIWLGAFPISNDKD